MSDNIIQDWIDSDPALLKIITQISATEKSFEEQALEAFHRLSTLYDLPKYPGELSDAQKEYFSRLGIDDPRSVFEEATIITFLSPDEDPRGIVMQALYNIKHGTFIDMNECALVQFGSAEKIPDRYVASFTGDGFAGTLHFPGAGESWAENGARCAIMLTK